MSATAEPRTRIHTHVTAPGVCSEELAARPLGHNTFIIDSVPFVDTTVALGDIVECREVAGKPHLNRVIMRGGNSTLRILPRLGIDIASPLLRLGCRVEAGPAGVFAISYGAHTPIAGILEWLNELADAQLIELSPGFQAT